jgi:hypothetical protein
MEVSKMNNFSSFALSLSVIERHKDTNWSILSELQGLVSLYVVKGVELRDFVEIGTKYKESSRGAVLNFNICVRGLGNRMPVDDDDDDLPSLKEIFSRLPKAKRVKSVEKENETPFSPPLANKGKSDEKAHLTSRVELKVNTAVFAFDFFKSVYVPAVVKERFSGADDCDLYKVEFFSGSSEQLGRKHIVCPEDSEFYSIQTVPLEEVWLDAKPFCESEMKKFIGRVKEDLEKILVGSEDSTWDVAFRTSSKTRASLNSCSSTGPFTRQQHNFLLEYFPEKLLPALLSKNGNRSLCETRFGKSGDSLDHLLRQYAYLVLMPEFIVRHISCSENISHAASKMKLLDSSDYDLQTGNYVNYLYSKQELYRYARREQRRDQ